MLKFIMHLLDCFKKIDFVCEFKIFGYFLLACWDSFSSKLIFFFQPVPTQCDFGVDSTDHNWSFCDWGALFGKGRRCVTFELVEMLMIDLWCSKLSIHKTGKELWTEILRTILRFYWFFFSQNFTAQNMWLANRWRTRRAPRSHLLFILCLSYA